MSDEFFKPPAEGGPLQGAAVYSDGRYEFAPYENLIIEKVAKRATWWGWLSLVAGILMLVGGFVAVATIDHELRFVVATVPLAVGGIYAAVGKLYIDTGASFLAVVHTHGNDIELFLRGLEKMANAFRIEAIVTAVMYGLVLLGLLWAVAA